MSKMKMQLPIPNQLIYWHSLNKRAALTQKQKKYYENIKKGFAGEKIWYSWLNELSQEVIILHDLTFIHNTSAIQIDFLCIFEKSMIAFEVKNYKGEVHVEGDRWKSGAGNEINNPLLQYLRSKSLLSPFLKNLKVNLPLEYYIVFVNPEFFPYQLPYSKHVILPQQLKRFWSHLNQMSSVLGGKHEEIKKLILKQKEQYQSQTVPCEWTDLKKGVSCPICDGLMIKRKRTVCCGQCDKSLSLDKAILYNIKELELVFPKIKISTNLVYEWCGCEIDKRVVYRVLKNNFKHLGNNKNRYYVREE